MSLSGTISKNIKLSTSYNPVAGVEVIDDNLALQLTDTVALSTTTVFAFPFAYAKLNALFVVSSLDATCIFQKAGPATEKTVNLIAGVPYVWTATYDANPFANNIVSISIQNGSSTAALTIDIVALVDAT